MRCKNCNSSYLRVWIDIQLYIDVEDYHHLTKKAIAKRTTEIWSMDDAKTVFICKDCQWTSKRGEMI